MKSNAALGKICALFIGMIVAHSNLLAASFDCANSHTDIELFICLDFRLGLLDDDLTEAYKAATKSDNLQRDQREWIIRRGKCATHECLENMYIDRIHQLQNDHHAYREASPGFAQPWDFPAPSGDVFFDSHFARATNGDPAFEFLPNPRENWIDIKTGKAVAIDRNSIVPHFLSNGDADSKRADLGIYIIESSQIKPHAVNLKTWRMEYFPNSYDWCASTIKDVHYEFISTTTPGRTLRLTIIERVPAGKEISRNSGNSCTEEDEATNLQYWPVDPSAAFTYEDQLYVSTFHGIVRIDGNLRTESRFLGKDVFFFETSSLNNQIAKSCGDISARNTKPGCVDSTLSRLINRISKYYQYHVQ